MHCWKRSRCCTNIRPLHLYLPANPEKDVNENGNDVRAARGGRLRISGMEKLYEIAAGDVCFHRTLELEF
jgi:hypothetical protein